MNALLNDNLEWIVLFLPFSRYGTRNENKLRRENAIPFNYYLLLSFTFLGRRKRRRSVTYNSKTISRSHSMFQKGNREELLQYFRLCKSAICCDNNNKSGGRSMANCTATIVILQKRGKQAWPRELLPLWQSIFADYPLIITYVRTLEEGTENNIQWKCCSWSRVHAK